jgi:hypothetical protein
MNKEFEQRQKFVEHFLEIIEEAPKEFKEKISKAKSLPFYNLTGMNFTPGLSPEIMELLPPELKKECDDIISKYHEKSL